MDSQAVLHGLLELPANNDLVYNPRPTFQWNSIPNAMAYQLQVDDAMDFRDPLVNESIDTLVFTPDFDLQAGSYFWRVQPIDIWSDAGGWSETWTVQIGHMVWDVDGNMYRAVKIGGQLWMAENLRVTHYRNGDALTHITDYSEWAYSQRGAYCIYGNNEIHAAVYGNLYNWYAIVDERGLTPEGWHVATDEEWKQLEMALGMDRYEVEESEWRGSDEGGKLKAISFWKDPNTGATNTSGFTALPAGKLSPATRPNNYNGMGSASYFWSTTERYDLQLWTRSLSYLYSSIGRYHTGKNTGLSIRCVQDGSSVDPQD